jgi:hypothetical protein
MIHLVFLSVFAVAVGIVLGAMLRREPRAIATLALWITGTLIASGVILGWILYLWPLVT